MLNITPNGKQEEVLALPASGHLIVLGTAGSGKTTIALLRAHHLANLPGYDKVLLVTFNGALVKYMRGISGSMPSKLVVENYHTFARGYLNSRGKMPRWNGILNSDEKNYYIEKALKYCEELHPMESTLKRSIEFFIEEISFIERFGFNDFSEYYQAERIGRASANVKRENRKWIYEVYEKYIEFREQAGRKYDWDDLALYVYRELKNDENDRRYTHIIIDEGQDFSPMMIKSLVSAIPDRGSFTFFGDVAQQIYGSRLSWRDSGINANKIWRLDVNYRNPETITAFARDIIRSEYWQEDSDMVEVAGCIAKGPKPILIKFKDRSREMEWVIRRAIAIKSTSSVAIVCRNRSDIDLFQSQINEMGYNSTEIDKDTPGYAGEKEIYLTTFHAAKGLEFENVFIPFLTKDRFPDPEIVANAVSKEEAYSDEIKLLYVAVTRSKYGLYMTYSGEISQLIPNSHNYDFYNEEGLI